MAATSFRIQPSADTLTHWADNLLPDLDVWFWDETDLVPHASRCLVISRADYLRHPEFQDIRYVNAYLHWQIPPEVTRMIVSGPGWISTVSGPDRNRILGKQVNLKRGLVFPESWFRDLPGTPEPFVVDDSVVLCHAAWSQLPDESRRAVLLSEQQRWDDVDCLPVPPGTPDHIRSVTNAFGYHEGANCLGITAYCVTGEDWMRRHWMYQPEFRNLLTRCGYRPASDQSPVAGDIVTFEADDRLVHAAYRVKTDRFLNKNGQSRFNPIRIVDWQCLEADWREATHKTYRQVRDHTH